MNRTGYNIKLFSFIVLDKKSPKINSLKLKQKLLQINTEQLKKYIINQYSKY
jgi:hypothetical protein